jgi:WD40 repeat protein
VASDDWAIVWYDATTMTEMARLPVGSRRAVVRDFSPDGRLVAIREQPLSPYGFSAMSTVRVFPVEPVLRGEQPAPVFQLTGSVRQLFHLVFSPDGTRLLAAGEGVLRLWDSASGAELLSIRLKQRESAGQLPCLFSPDGHHIWAGLDEHEHLWGWDATPLPDEVLEP